MEIEHVAGVGLAARRAPQDQRELAVRRGLLGEVVVHAERGLPLLVHEVLGDGAARVRRDVLERRRLRGGGDDHDGVVHRARILQPFDHRGHRGALLADGDVDADDAGAPLIDDGVHRDGGLAGAAVTDDQLPLAAADRDHRVDGLDAGLKRLLHRLPHDDARRHHLHLAGPRALDLAPAVDRPTQRVHHPPQHRGAHRHVQQAAGAADLVAFLQLQVVAHDRGADVVLLQIQHQAGDDVAGLLRGELQHLAGDRGIEPIDPGDAVAHLEHRADLGDVVRAEVRRLDFMEQDVLEFAGTEGSVSGHEF